MSRPRTGLSFDEALRRWSPADEHAEMEALHEPRFDVTIKIIGAPPDPREEAYHELRRRLESALLVRLAHGELLSSATEEVPDPRNPRFLVHPSVYDDQDLSYSRVRNAVLGRSTQLWNIEIFEPNQMPRNISKLPDWLDQFAADRETGVASPEPSPPADTRSIKEFRHDRGYAHVEIGGTEFALNPTQAGIVRVLHREALEGRPWVRGDALRHEVGFNHEKLSAVFRHVKNPSWRDLIASDRRGGYRLNVHLTETP